MQENNIYIIKKQAHETVDFNNDYTLPDYIIDVRKLIRCDSKAVLHNVYRNENLLSFEGEVIYSILVICEDNSIKNIIYSEDFVLNSSSAVNCEISVHDCKLENVSVRLISPRKLNCKSKVVVTTKNNSEENVSPHYCGKGIPEAEYTTEKKLSKCEYIMLKDTVIQNQHASRDIELSQDKEEISNIVYCKINTRINERKLTEGKLFLRGETVAEILYESINGNYTKLYDRSPFNDVIENEFDTNAHICEASVSDIKATVRNNTFGEMRVMELDYTYNIKSRQYVNKETEILSDIYSTEYDVNCKYKAVTSLKLDNVFSSSLSINDFCNMEEMGGEIFESVIDSNASLISTNIKADVINKRLIISGDLKFDIVYKGEELGHISVVRPYKYEREYDGSSEDVYCEHYIDVQSASAILDKERILLNAELYFNVMIARCCEYEYIEEAEFITCECDNKSPVIIYYPTKGDTLWDIAKKYKSTCKDIISVNSLESDSLDGIKVLLLPKKKQKSVFNAII